MDISKICLSLSICRINLENKKIKSYIEKNKRKSVFELNFKVELTKRSESFEMKKF
jgi:hypothetical protein